MDATTTLALVHELANIDMDLTYIMIILGCIGLALCLRFVTT